MEECILTSRAAMFQIPETECQETSDCVLQQTSTWKLGHCFFEEPLLPTAIDHGDDVRTRVHQTVGVECGRVDVPKTVAGPYIGYSSSLCELLAGFMAILDGLIGSSSQQC